MPPEKAPETSEEIFDQIRNADIGEGTEEEISEETEEQEEVVEEPSGEEEPKPEEEPEPTKEEKEQEPQLYPINVDGNIEMVTQEQLVQFAQKGRFLERERAKDKAKETGEVYDPKKADEQFYAKVKEKGFVGAMAELFGQGQQMITEQRKEVRKEARAIADGSEWGKEQTYRDMHSLFVEDGMNPIEAGIHVSAKYWEERARKGQEIGAKKQEAKDAVNIPKGQETTPDSRESGTEASVMEGYEELQRKKAPSKDLLAYMRKHGVPVGKDDLTS